ncbi:hypothetical protein ABZT47_10025 [Sphaerisporangium sp. NPDC005289]
MATLHVAGKLTDTCRDDPHGYQASMRISRSSDQPATPDIVVRLR